ncbi:MAG TPA: carbohydrate kinase [Terriglobales bacterium]|nr:carbohydrate kinase [Terriglobales bacterium]
MGKRFTVVGLGEILWDLFPGGKQLGGAPTNFAYISTLLGDLGVVASRVGRDDLGSEALERLKILGVESSYVQLDASHRTGTVRVHLDRRGQPRFMIHEDVAWDFLSWNSRWKRLAREADAVCFGTLAQRSPRSRRTIRQFLRNTRGIRVFDVNLRQSFYSAEILRESVCISTIVKMNHEELPVILKLLGLAPGEDKLAAKRLLRLGPKLVCVTRGDEGSVLVNRRGAAENRGFRVRVVDTVGSGDAFTAALAHQYLRGSSLEKMNDAANRMGSWVATQAGGTPMVAKEGLHRRLAELR